MTGFVPNAGQPQTTGAGVGGAVGAAVGGMLSEAAIASTSAEVQKLVDSAKSGGFAISEEGANEYIKVFRGFEDQLNALETTVQDASQSPQLGGSTYASTVASETVKIATGDHQSYSTALRSLGVIVKQAREAFEDAKKNYAQMDDDAKQTFGGIQV
ncbi:hypothetical protein LWP59_00920 [Amycolatopsis acidiphila]|uniref:PE domain-containing protein n=1 Tax=Amycolatopsis acidiphila TaxID=715473 RepID=A0A558AMR1_9PSEU|nr:hypothetical protein [Amycolatopsis acidiphila]TVT25549.1 hypothetical protein FNH06_01685 [Amycolatopsis acidiphila]UIJ60297.1 hypothetical protein LWP59_00920 [Amycolatopsis acidiphila]GHG60230.1 hypothetical protein GCM10017788_13790 [Amycolatopsis acidiphila]